MINTVYKLTYPMCVETFCENLDYNTGDVLVKPRMLSICKADMRYYFGMRDPKVLKQRLPLALIHEAWGTVLHDKSGQFKTGDKVILLPNIPGAGDKYRENYRLDSLFRSSRADGFMQEMVCLPHSQVVGFDNIPRDTAAITELISVCTHAVNTFLERVTHQPERIGVWGDGALGYIICALLKYYIPKVHLTVIGISRPKLEMFEFANERLTVDEVTVDMHFDSTFECVGGQASGSAISQMIDTIMPEGFIMLMGVSEEPVPVNTRMVLEKGLTLVGRSRSGRVDFEETVRIMQENERLKQRMKVLISDIVEIKNINDIHKAFNEAKTVDFKLVMDWKL
ncbi:MAG: alcohol dehydrogenase catalytic domain-containing protein [Lachnospiraceae bacterium]|nr:alcohol dehydrogenase catalytic domain-containing protein [Lachnospiraceae bacterium]